jgi:flagellar biosynthesis/type III secretory pathway M-ring protein FliF/YscJ
VTAVVAVVGSRQEAELIVGMLKNHNIHAVVSADDAGRVDLALQAQGVRVLVPDSQVSRARQLLGDKPAPAGRLNRFQRLLVRLLGGARDASHS